MIYSYQLSFCHQTNYTNIFCKLVNFNNGLEISFVAGEKNPVNAEQYASFEAFLQKILKIAPALNVFGDNERPSSLFFWHSRIICSVQASQ